MKNIFFVLFAGLIMVSVMACQPSPEKLADEKMNEIVTRLKAVGLSVAVVKDNKIVYTGAFGFKDLEDSVALEINDIFRIASISKSFTATAIMQLVESGKFTLDDDVSQDLGLPVRNPNFPDIPITYRMLLTHTSGLNDTTGYYSFDVIDPEKTPEYWRAYNNYLPGSRYEYCNLGFNLLGALVEIHSGERFDNYIRQHIINPLHLNAGYNVDSLDPELFVPLYNDENGKFVCSTDAYLSPAERIAKGYVMGRTTPVFSPTGGMKIAPKDLARHMLIQMNRGTFDGIRILQPESVQAMQTPYMYEGENTNYGFAIKTTDKLIPGVTMKGHTGSAYGLYSAMFFEPEKKFGFITMTNGYPEGETKDGFMTISSEAINALHDIFILSKSK